MTPTSHPAPTPARVPRTPLLLALPLLLLLLLLLLPSSLSAAESHPRKKVRVPCEKFNRLLVTDDDGLPVSGYAHDFLETIATYAGWDLEYIPVNNFSNSLRMLQKDQADVFYDVSYTPERAKSFLFPDEPMGFEYFYLFATAENTDIDPDDFASLEGKKVGVTAGTMQVALLEQWCKKKNVHLQFVEYPDIPSKEADLLAGKIDFDLEVSIMADSRLSAIEKIGSSTYYLAVNKKRPDLLDDVNFAMDKVLNNDLYFFTRLQERYFSDTVVSRNLTRDEKAWIASHDVLRAGYFDDYLPFSSRGKNGEPIGSAVEAVQAIVKNLNLDDRLEVQFVCYPDQKKAFKAVEAGEIDLVFPAYVSAAVRRDYRIIAGKGFATMASDLAFLEEYGEGAGKRIGVNRSNLMQYYYSKDSYPNSQIVFYDDIWDCLDGLLEGSCDGTFLNGVRTAALLRPGKYHALHSVRAKDAFQLHMVFAEDNIGLMLLMDRGLTMLDPDFIPKASFTFAGGITLFSAADFLLEHILEAIVLAAILAALLVALLASWVNGRKQEKINRALERNFFTIQTQRQQERTLRKKLQNKQKELKNALVMAQAANRAKTRFLSNMSHDIRTPMNAIIGFTGLAAAHIDDKQHVQECLDTIAQSSDHLLSLINDVLDMSVIEAGKMVLREKPESLADIVHALCNIVRTDVHAKRHHLSVEAVDVRHELVLCDKLHLDQILFNLVSNAVKYTPAGGKISFRVSELSASDDGKATFEFRCRDNGIGMDPEFAKTVFDPFTREQDALVSGIQGTGLGMSIAKNIVELMGGSIAVDSQKGKGTEVVVTVPFKLAGDPPPNPRIPALEGQRALVADRAESVAHSIAAMLRNVGMRPECSASPQEAADLAERALRESPPFKVCILDGSMPGDFDLESIRRIRRALAKDALLILLAPDDESPRQAEARNAGVDAFAPQPLFPSDLQKLLRPFSGDKNDRPAPPSDASFSLKGLKVLLVDDSPLNLKIGSLLLRERGILVDTAANGQLAVDQIREKGPTAYDVVLMDIQMPVLDGYGATAAIRKLPGARNLKIIAFSANAFAEDKEKSLEAGMDGHLTKPLKIREFLQELHSITTRPRPFRPSLPRIPPPLAPPPSPPSPTSPDLPPPTF